MRLRALGATLSLLGLAVPSAAWAVPNFARTYGTTCQTCHVAFPKNTPFGEAFRRNGYRFPGGNDEDYRRVESQKLGADAYRDVFPEAVWPGALPASVPLSVVLIGSVEAGPGAGDGQLSFANLGGTVRLTAATTLGSRVSAWAGLAVAATGNAEPMLMVERVFVIFSLFEKPWLNLRVGRLEPGVFSFSGHRGLGPVPWITFATVGDSPFALEPSHFGLEATGVFGGRGTWSLGVVEGAGNLSLPKDGYLRLGTKLGGMRLDGESEGEVDLADPAPWREWSVQLGAFGYLGQTPLGTPAVATQDDRFFMVGGDINAHLRDLNLVVAYTLARHRRPFLARPGVGLDVHQLLVQLDYVLFPWLVPFARFEYRAQSTRPAGPADALVTEPRAMLGAYVLIRANVRTNLIASLRQTNGRIEFDRLQLAFSVGL